MSNPSAQHPPAGWYPNAQGQPQWWDGTRWGPLAQASGAPTSTHATAAASTATPTAASELTRTPGAAVELVPAHPHQAPADWYPAGENTLRYWDGTNWTEYTAPALPQTQQATQKPNQNSSLRIRWRNILSLRWWWFTLGGTLFFTILIGMLSPAIAGGLFPLLFAGVGFVWLTIPMTCEHCGKMLKSSKIGDVTICHHCHQPVS